MTKLTKTYKANLYARLMGEAQALGIPSETQEWKTLLDLTLLIPTTR